MSLFSRNPPPRQPHLEPGFEEAAYVAEYSEENRKHAGGDTQPLFAFAAQFLSGRPSAKILEIGPGPGWIAIRLAQNYPAACITGIDPSHTFLAQAERNAAAAGVASRVAFVPGDAADMAQFADAAFDLVVSHQSLHYWTKPSQVFNEIARVLTTEGGFFLSDDRRDLGWAGQFQVWLGLRILSRRIGESWRESLRGCFTAAEAQALLERSALRGRAELVTRARVLFVRSRP